MGLTVYQLRNFLKNLDDDTPVYIAGPDSKEYETIGKVTDIGVYNQEHLDVIKQHRLSQAPEHKIKGDYLLLSV